MRFSQALDLMRLGLAVGHDDWEPTTRLWLDNETKQFRVSTRRGEFLWQPEADDLMTDGWRHIMPAHELALQREAELV